MVEKIIECLNAERIDWREFERLLRECDVKKNAEFSSRIVPTEREILGWYIPNLRKIAKGVAREKIPQILDAMPQGIYEETVLHALLLGRLSDRDELSDRLDDFIPTIDNWATCDILCGELKIIQKNPDYFWSKIKSWMESADEFVARFGIVLMKNYYLTPPFVDEVLALARAKRSNLYYINMALGWLWAEACISWGQKVMTIFDTNPLESDVVKFTKGKVRDSFRVSPEVKEYFRSINAS